MAESTEKAPQQPIVTERVVTREVKEPPLGPNATSEAPEDHFFIVNEKKVNAFGEEIGSPEDKKRRG